MVEGKVLSKEWTLDEVDLLIKLVRENPELYDKSKPGYANVNVLENCWQVIADCMQTKNMPMCKAKWQILRGCYRSRRSGGKGSKKWAYYDSLTFLDDYIGKRKSYIKTETPEHETDDYFETIILDPNMDYETSQITIEGKSLTEESSSSESQDVIKKRKYTSCEIEEALEGYFRSKKPKSSIHLFLQSMEEDMAKLSPKGLRNFKSQMLQALENLLVTEGKDRI